MFYGDSNAPLVSVIMPVYNGQKYLLDSATSVLDQTMADFELIIIDNNSSDESFNIASGLKAEDSRVVLLRCDRPGADSARNMGIRESRGRFIAFLDSDDLWLKSKLEIQIELMMSQEYCFTFTSYERIRESGLRTGVVVSAPARLGYEELLKSNQIGCLTAVYDRHAIGKRYMPLIKKRQDYGLWLSILKDGHFAYGIADVLALYRVHPSGSVSSNKLSNVRYNWKLFRDLEKFSILRSGYYVAWNIFRKVFG